MVTREKELSAEFYSIQAPLDNWGAFVDYKIMELVRDEFHDSNFVQIEPKHRCKDSTSFIRKALYRSKNNNYPNPIVDIEDKVATRIVLLTTDNVKRVTALVTSCSDWDNKISKDTKEISRENPNLFDYQSVHVVVWPKETFEGTDRHILTCEIQIRTLLEHAYAEVTHDSVYKGPYQNDTVIKRQLSKCMALMETTDDMFCDIFKRISLKSESGANAYTKLLAHTAELYNDVTGMRADYRKSDVYFLDAILFLFNEKPINTELLDQYVFRHKQDINVAIRTNPSVLVREPAILILFCYIEYYDEFVINNWPLSSTIVDSMRDSLDISEGEN